MSGELVVTLRLSEVWVRGQLLPNDEGWKLLEICTSQQMADEHCVLSNEFIAPAPLNKPFPEGDIPRAYFPRRQI
jgi:hypothetical protein